MEFKLLIDADVLDEMKKIPASQRRDLMNHFRLIQGYPDYYENYAERDSNGRLIGVSIFRRWAIKYWTDAADRHVKVLALVSADC
jgi:hypothetical protein